MESIIQGLKATSVVVKAHAMTFLSGGMSSAASSMGISSNDGSSIGTSIIPSIVSLFQKIGIVVGVISLAIVAIIIMISRKNEQRTDAMTRILWIALGIFILSILTVIIGFFVGLS